MKKLRMTDIEKKDFIEAIKTKLNNKTVISDLSIDDIKNSMSKVYEELPKPTLLISAETYVKMYELVLQSDTEVSWHGLVVRDKAKRIYMIYDILVFPQINSTTSTTTDETEFADWQTKLIMNPEFPIENLRMHGHSHVNMNVFSSGIDDQYQNDLITKVENDDYYIFLVLNKKMEMCILLYDFTDQILYETKDIKMEITGTNTSAIKAWCKTQLDTLCKTKTTKSLTPNNLYGYDYNSIYGDLNDDDYFTPRNTITTNKKPPIFKGGKKNGLK